MLGSVFSPPLLQVEHVPGVDNMYTGPSLDKPHVQSDEYSIAQQTGKVPRKKTKKNVLIDLSFKDATVKSPTYEAKSAFTIPATDLPTHSPSLASRLPWHNKHKQLRKPYRPSWDEFEFWDPLSSEALPPHQRDKGQAFDEHLGNSGNLKDMDGLRLPVEGVSPKTVLDSPLERHISGSPPPLLTGSTLYSPSDKGGNAVDSDVLGWDTTKSSFGGNSDFFKAPRRSRACIRCRLRRIPCDGELRCSRCKMANAPCQRDAELGSLRPRPPPSEDKERKDPVSIPRLELGIASPIKSPKDYDEDTEHRTGLVNTEPRPSESSPPTQTTKPRHSPRLRQVGMVRIRIEQVSLFKHYNKEETSSRGEWSDFEECEECDDGSKQTKNDTVQDEQDDKSPNNGDSSGSSSSSRKHRCQRSKGKKRTAILDGDDNGNSGNSPDQSDGDDTRRRPHKQLKPDSKKPLQRLACPYHVFYREQDCLHKSSNNPDGGAADISRLKQHLNRKHKMSHRCQRCWAAFDSKHQVQKHTTQQFPCQTKSKPANERFMLLQEEQDIDNPPYRQQDSEEEKWFHLFKILIPEMRHYELSMLRDNICPYYTPLELTLLIPPLQLPQSLFEGDQVVAPASDHDRTNLNNMALAGPFISSGSIRAPLLEMSGDALGIDSQFSYHPIQGDTTSLSDMSVLTSSYGMGSGTGGFAGIASSIPSSSQPTSGESHCYRNYERLKKRNRETEETLAKLRAQNSDNEQDLNMAERKLDGLLDSDGLTDSLFDELAAISAILGAVKSRLR